MMTTHIQCLSVKLKTISLEMSIHSHILARKLLIMSLILLYVNYSQENSLRLIAFINMKTFSRTTLSHLSPEKKIFDSLFRSKLVYACQTWSLTESSLNPICSIYSKNLRNLVKGGQKWKLTPLNDDDVDSDADDDPGFPRMDNDDDDDDYVDKSKLPVHVKDDGR